MNESIRNISIFDTTLRDGEQAPGASLQPEQKIALARKLADLGVDVMEPGFPVSSPGEFAAVQAISRELQGVEICGFARAVKGDIDAAVKATQDAARRRIHLFISSSDIHLRHQLRMSRPEVVARAREMTAYAKQFSDIVEFTAMDASRTGIDDLIEMVEAAIEEGATIINLPDTVGYALPDEYGEMFRRVREGARGGKSVSYSAHCHNDLGLAVANSLAAIQNGASQIEVTVNGIGERTGNCALEELVMALSTRGDILRAQTGITAEKLYEVSRLVSGAMHFPIAFNKPVVGRNAFQHESGIHQDGLLKDRSTYEIMDPEKLGIPRSMIVLGKHSGRHALKDRLARYGVQLEAARWKHFMIRLRRRLTNRKLLATINCCRWLAVRWASQHRYMS
ncbi:2-isopropylmalate synthase [Paenibacillus sp. JCM 10914]|nr:2-isopropylmalate synthase [Paenibacillus sp. JCM 10914]